MKKVSLILGLIFLITILSGCTEIDQPITEDSKGIWNQFVVYPLSWLIIKIANAVGGSWGYGLSIIIVTILIRLAILPLMVKQLQSSKAMQAIQPELENLRKKYSSKDAVTQRKLQEEQLKLMQKYNINPFAGCLPIFIQMPILIGFYHAIVRTEEIKENSFLWFELANPDPYYILPLIAGFTTFIQQKVMISGQNTNPQMAMMLWLMPIMIISFSIFVPSALPLYWIVGNIFTIIQSYFIKTPELEMNQARGSLGGKKR